MVFHREASQRGVSFSVLSHSFDELCMKKSSKLQIADKSFFKSIGTFQKVCYNNDMNGLAAICGADA